MASFKFSGSLFFVTQHAGSRTPYSLWLIGGMPRMLTNHFKTMNAVKLSDTVRKPQHISKHQFSSTGSCLQREVSLIPTARCIKTSQTMPEQ